MKTQQCSKGVVEVQVIHHMCNHPENMVDAIKVSKMKHKPTKRLAGKLVFQMNV